MFGEGEMFFEDGKKYVGNFVDNAMHGRGTMIYKNG